MWAYEWLFILAGPFSKNACLNGRLFERVIGRHLKERAGGLAAHDIREAIHSLADERVGMLRHDDDLELRRIPPFRDDLNGLLVADVPGRDSHSRAGPFGLNTFDGLLAERLRCPPSFITGANTEFLDLTAFAGRRRGDGDRKNITLDS